jgi:metallo-beta-lactamase class B
MKFHLYCSLFLKITLELNYMKSQLISGSQAHFGDPAHLEPTRLFDNVYFVGTRDVGIVVIDSGDGIILIDAGWSKKHTSILVNDIKKLGLNPGNIKLILISHEHMDHYGGVPYLKKEVCPNAKVALSTVGWYCLQAKPFDPSVGPRINEPESIDVFLTDGQKITLGNTEVQIVATPGHSAGCVSFIVPVTDRGIRHALGIMGGAGLQNPNWEKVYLYKSSIDYFQKFTREALCDVGFAVHAWDYEEDMAFLRIRKSGDPNPLVIGPEKFESFYLQIFREIVKEAVRQMPPEFTLPLPAWVSG